MLTLDTLDRRVRQMHASLAGLVSTDVSEVSVRRGEHFGGFYVYIDFGGGRSDAELYNIAEQLVANIARMKDHLKAWCVQNSLAFAGDQLINCERAVAIVHDLWNSDKHAVLNSQPRSGHRPRLVGLNGSMVLSTGPGPSSVQVSFDPQTGGMRTEASGGGGVHFQIDGDVVNEHGVTLGRFTAICEEAVTKWEAALSTAGVPIAPR